MSPPRPQVPDRVASGETSQIETAAPPESSTRFNFPCAKKAIDRPSGEKKSELAPSVPGMGRASGADSGRRKMRCPPCGSDTTYASCDPSGETARKETSTKYEKVAFAGGGTEKRIVCGDCPRGPRASERAATATAMATATLAISHGRNRTRKRRGVASAGPGVTAPSEMARSCRPTSWAACHRSAGSLAREVRIRPSSAGGLIGCREETGGGSEVRIAEMSDAWLVPENAFLPVAIS